MAYVGETGAGDGVSGLGIRALLRARSWRYYHAHRRPFDSGCIAFVGDLREVPRWFEAI